MSNLTTADLGLNRCPRCGTRKAPNTESDEYDSCYVCRDCGYFTSWSRGGKEKEWNEAVIEQESKVKKYNIKDPEFVCDKGEWVPADVAEDMYNALERLVAEYIAETYKEFFRAPPWVCRAQEALAKARGES